MKPSQLKTMLGRLIGIGLTCVLLLIILLINQLSINKQLKTLNDNSSQTATSNNSSQLTSLQNSVNALSTKVGTTQTPTVNTSDSMTCTGTLSQDLSGSASQIGSFTDYSLSGSSPIDLTCNKL
jgi:hypothetical protein